VKRITVQDLDLYSPRENILLIGHSDTGKSTDIVMIAEAIRGKGRVFVIDTENGIIKVWKNLFRHVDNLELILCASIDDVLKTFEELQREVQPQDWIAFESMAKIWEMAQDKAYLEVAGMTKAEYLVTKDKAQSPVPQPQFFWQIAKHYYEGGIIDPMRDLDPMMAELVKRAKSAGCNIIATTLLAKERPDFMESRRRQIAQELGFNILWEGSPRLPSYFDTVVVTSKPGGEFRAAVIKDRGYERPKLIVEFEVKQFWHDFQQNCRAGLCPRTKERADPELCAASAWPECQACVVRR